MFEHDQKIVSKLLEENDQFKRLYDKHSALKKAVNDANTKNSSTDGLRLENMKKEKLLLKDQMARMIEEHRQANAS